MDKMTDLPFSGHHRFKIPYISDGNAKVNCPDLSEPNVETNPHIQSPGIGTNRIV